MVRPQHDSQGKGLPDPGKRRDRQTGSARMINRNCYEVLGARIYGKKRGLDRVCATRYQQQIYIFFDTSAQGDLGRSSSQVMRSISCAGVLPIVQHTRARKHQHKHVI
jgi:hypothetical protein